MEPEWILDHILLWPTLEERGGGNLDYHESLRELAREEAYAEVGQEQGLRGAQLPEAHSLGEDLVGKKDSPAKKTAESQSRKGSWQAYMHGPTRVRAKSRAQFKRVQRNSQGRAEGSDRADERVL